MGSKKWHMCQEHLQTIETIYSSRNEPLHWVSNFKVHQTWDKKNKSFELQTLVPVQVWCTRKFKTFVFFVPAQVWCALKFKTFVFFPCAGLVRFEF